MPNRTLTKEELVKANALLNSIRDRLQDLSAGDLDLQFAYRRKIFKELTYDERSLPMVRRKLKRQKRALQNGKCAVCTAELPESYTVLDRLNAVDGYTAQNTRLICESCDRRVQIDRRYS